MMKILLVYTVNIMAADALVTCHQGISSHDIDLRNTVYQELTATGFALQSTLHALPHAN